MWWQPLAAIALAFFNVPEGPEVASGPDRGSNPAPLKVFDATGPHKGQEIDYAGERKGKQTIFLFIPAAKWDRPMARFVRKLDEVQPEGSQIVAVWLTDDAEKTKAYLPLAQQSLQLARSALTCFTGNLDGPPGWNINLDARMTVVVTDGQKVVRTFGYQSVNETNVSEVRDVLKKK